METFVESINSYESQVLGITKPYFNDQLSYLGTWSPSKLEEEFGKSLFLGTLRQKKLVSYVLYQENSEAFDIVLLATSKLFSRKGLMKLLMEKLIKRAQVKNKEVWLEVHEKNIAAYSLYVDSLGFVEAGKRQNYYPDGASAISLLYR